MRLSDRHRTIVEQMEKDGYVWLSHLPVTAQMRFRSKVKKGFKGFVIIENLTFLTKRVADFIVKGTIANNGVRLTLSDQVRLLEDQLVELESELYRQRGVGPRQEKFKFATEDPDTPTTNTTEEV